MGRARGVALTLSGGGRTPSPVLVGLYFSSAVHGAVINPGLTPIASVLLSRAILDERPPLGAVVGIPVTLVGIVLVAGAGLWSRGSGTWVGDAILAASAVFYGLVTVLLRRWRIAPVPATAAINMLSAVVWVPCYDVLTGLRPLLAAPIEETIGQAIFLGGFAGGVAGLLYVHGIHVLGPSQAAQFQALVPVFGTLLAAGLLGEHLSMLQWTGIAAVVIGMLTAA